MFDFDKPIDRRRTNCAKWDGMLNACGVSPDDGIAMWVADMDFEAPPAVNATLHRLADHGVHGYFADDRAYTGAIAAWMAERHGWTVEPEWIVTVPGLVSGLGMVLQALTEPGDGIITFNPVYHAFARVINANGRRVVESPLVEENGRYVMDLETLGANMDPGARMVVFCSPHNPGGRVWEAEEIRALATFCAERDLILVSDEVHHDLVFPGHTHIVTANAAPEIADRLVTMTGPSKTFGINGALNGQLTVVNAEMRTKIQTACRAAGLGPNRLSMMMTTAAYAHGAEWTDALVAYLDENRKMFDAGVNALPGIRSMTLEGTYLAWVDFSGTGMNQEEITRRVAEEARIGTNNGPTFGTGGDGFLRINFATRRALVANALERLEHAFADLQ